MRSRASTSSSACVARLLLNSVQLKRMPNEALRLPRGFAFKCPHMVPLGLFSKRLGTLAGARGDGVHYGRLDPGFELGQKPITGENPAAKLRTILDQQ